MIFCAFEGFLETRPQRVQKGHVKGPNGIKKHHQSFYTCWGSFSI